MNHSYDEAREHLMNQVLSATTREEIADAWEALDEWLKQYPEEEGMRDGFEQLSLLQDIIEIQESRRQQDTQQVA